MPFTIPADGTADAAINRVVVSLAAHPAYQGMITGLRIAPPPGRQPQACLTVRAVVVQRAR